MLLALRFMVNVNVNVNVNGKSKNTGQMASVESGESFILQSIQALMRALPPS